MQKKVIIKRKFKLPILPEKAKKINKKKFKPKRAKIAKDFFVGKEIKDGKKIFYSISFDGLQKMKRTTRGLRIKMFKTAQNKFLSIAGRPFEITKKVFRVALIYQETKDKFVSLRTVFVTSKKGKRTPAVLINLKDAEINILCKNLEDLKKVKDRLDIFYNASIKEEIKKENEAKESTK